MIQTHILLITVRPDERGIVSGIRIRNAYSEESAIGLALKALKEEFPGALSYDVDHMKTLDQVAQGMPLYLNGSPIEVPS
jgi:hypothetical protein